MCSSLSRSGATAPAPHQQVLGLLVHREGDDLADVRLVGEQHDDAVDAGRRAAVRRRAVAEGVAACRRSAPRPRPPIAGDLEGLEHDVGPVVADRARRQLDAVADDVVLVGQDRRAGPCCSSASSPPCGIENGLWLNSILPVSSFALVHREVDDPAELEGVLARSGRARRPSRGARGAGELGRRSSASPADEEHRVAGASAPSARERRDASRRRGTWRSGPWRLAVAEDDVAEAPARPALCAQSISLSKKLRGCSPRPAPGSPAPTPPGSIAFGEHLKPEPREDVGDVGDARAGCAGRACRCRTSASPRDRGCAGTAPASPSRPSPNSSNTPCSTGSIAREHVVLRDEGHLEVELVELAGRAVGARVLVAEARRDLEIAVEARRPSAAA